MDRNSRRRIRTLTGQIATNKEELGQDWKLMEKYFQPRALLHGVAVAAIVLRGEPKVDEPLELAWVRAGERFGFDTDFVLTSDYTDVARALLPKIISSERNWWFLSEAGMEASKSNADYQMPPIVLVDYDGNPVVEPVGPYEEAAQILAQIFHAAPAWLLTFTAVAFDALFLDFELPDLSGPSEWGRDGFEESMRWPELPLGTMGAGEPRDPSPFDCLSTDDLIFLMSLREKSEDDWSLTERRRRRAILQQVWRRAEELERLPKY